MKDWIKRHYEAWHVMRASKILMDRNVTRSMVVSRRDNNDMWYMAERLESVAKRMRENYENE
jgi:hypothetical protein